MTGSFTEVIFSPLTAAQSELLIATLDLLGYEGFEESVGELRAYIPSTQFELVLINELASRYAVSFRLNELQPTNWNQQWESNFDPVTIGSFLHIRASFHPSVSHTIHEIVITPKMSFGTGHHATTRLMATEMSKLQWAQKSVFDFGTGTGILAILAEKLGAAKVTAIDNDTWSIENATENIIANQCSHVQLALSDQLPEQGKYDFVLANINTFIIKQYLPSLTTMLAPEGQLLLSGLLVEDITALISSCDVLGLRVLSAETLGDWGLLRLSY